MAPGVLYLGGRCDVGTFGMSKLTSGALKELIVQLAPPYLADRFPGDLEMRRAGLVAANWKRAFKKRIGTGETPAVFQEILRQLDYCEYLDRLDPQSITPDCWIRHFVNTVLEDGLDPIIVTDPLDERVLLISWHAD